MIRISVKNRIFRVIVSLFIISSVFAKSPYKLKPEPKDVGRNVKDIDVNAYEDLEKFINAAHLQALGKPAPKDIIAKWKKLLMSGSQYRRIDVVNTFAQQSGRTFDIELHWEWGKAVPKPKDEYYFLKFTDPWVDHPLLTNELKRTTKREIVAIWMIWNHCPGRVNCWRGWGNHHVPGMHDADAIMGWDDKPRGYYNCTNAAFYYMDLMDARYAGVSALLPNVYGAECLENSLEMQAINAALERIEREGWSNPCKIAMMDDTWMWGKPWHGPIFEQTVDMANVQKAVELIMIKWKGFWSQIPRKFWYTVDGRPYIYFYNAGTIKNAQNSRKVFSKCIEMFKAEFGIAPYLAMDSYFTGADPTVREIIDSEILWFTLAETQKYFRTEIEDNISYCAMTRWDSLGRDAPGEPASGGELMIKGSEILEHVLDSSQDANFLQLHTWNDLGEGTGMNRCFDYYYKGKWLEPSHFMNVLRKSQGLDPEDKPRDPEKVDVSSLGLTYKYYTGSFSKLPSFGSLKAVKSGQVNNFNIEARTKDTGIAFAFEGYVDIPELGNWKFFLNSGDGSRLYIGKKLVVDNDGLKNEEEKSGYIALKPGKHSIRVEFFNKNLLTDFNVKYAGPGVSKQIIPGSVLCFKGNDNIPPEIVSYSPAVSDTKAPFNSRIKLKLNEESVLGTGMVKVYEKGGKLIEEIDVTSDQVSFTDKVYLEIDPKDDFRLKGSYYINIDKGIVSDSKGNAFPGISGASAYSFSTVPYAGMMVSNTRTGSTYEGTKAIQLAINDKKTDIGDTLHTYPGVYDGDIRVTASGVKIVALNELAPVVVKGGDIAFEVLGNDVHITGFMITEAAGNGVFMDRVLGCRIYSNDICYNGNNGVWLRSGAYNQVYDNRIYGNVVNGFEFWWDAKLHIIRNNSIYSNNFGINLAHQDVKHIMICSNDFWNNEKQGIKIQWGATQNTFTRNLFRNNKIHINFEGPASNNIIINNTFIRGQRAFWCKWLAGAEVYNNIFKDLEWQALTISEKGTVTADFNLFYGNKDNIAPGKLTIIGENNIYNSDPSLDGEYAITSQRSPAVDTGRNTRGEAFSGHRLDLGWKESAYKKRRPK